MRIGPDFIRGLILMSDLGRPSGGIVVLGSLMGARACTREHLRSHVARGHVDRSTIDIEGCVHRDTTDATVVRVARRWTMGTISPIKYDVGAVVGLRSGCDSINAGCTSIGHCDATWSDDSSGQKMSDRTGLLFTAQCSASDPRPIRPRLHPRQAVLSHGSAGRRHCASPPIRL